MTVLGDAVFRLACSTVIPTILASTCQRRLSDGIRILTYSRERSALAPTFAIACQKGAGSVFSGSGEHSRVLCPMEPRDCPGQF